MKTKIQIIRSEDEDDAKKRNLLIYDISGSRYDPKEHQWKDATILLAFNTKDKNGIYFSGKSIEKVLPQYISLFMDAYVFIDPDYEKARESRNDQTLFYINFVKVRFENELGEDEIPLNTADNALPQISNCTHFSKILGRYMIYPVYSRENDLYICSRCRKIISSDEYNDIKFEEYLRGMSYAT